MAGDGRRGPRPRALGAVFAYRRRRAELHKVHHDEQRHNAYGTWYLALGERVRATLRDLLPAAAASLAPPDRGDDTDWEAFGASADEIRTFALTVSNRRLKIIAVDLG